MTSKNVKIISFLTVILLTVMLSGAVFAAENTNSTVSADNTVTADMVKNVETTQITDDTQEAVASDNTITKTSDKAALKSAPAGITLNGTDTADYATVKYNIESNPQYSDFATTLTLNLSSPTYTITEPITFNAKSTTTELILNGHGAVIDGSSTQSFLIIGEGATVTLNDFKVINTKGDYGGAIVNHGTLTVNNVEFDSNTATYKGGAIYNVGTLTVDESTFKNNLVTNGKNRNDDGGAAIFTNNTLTVSRSVFDNNIAKYIDDSAASDGGNGGAINVLDCTADVYINNCTFTNNKGRHGGSIIRFDNKYRNQGETIINNTVFKNNKATYGGAIEVYCDFTVENSTFEDNEVDGYGNTNTNSPSGGAILINGGNKTAVKATLKNNTFTNNIAHNTYSNDAGQGSAVYMYTENGDVEIDDCTFTSNEAYTGGTIYVFRFDNDLTVTDSDFVNNKVTTNGKTISPQGTLTASGITINGVAISSMDNEGNIIIDIPDYESLVTFFTSVKTIGITDPIIGRLTGETYTETTPIIVDELPCEVIIDGNGKTIDAYNQQFLTINADNTLTVKNLTVKNAKADNGAAIYNKGTLTVSDSTFDSNTATYKGGAIYNVGTLTVDESTFKNNLVTNGVNRDDDGGAAIFTNNTLTVSKSVFDNNIAKYTDDSTASNGGNGGAINVLNCTADVYINNCTFTNNKGRHGGAIIILDNQYRDQGNKVINGTIFKNNKATYGGAIETYDDTTIENCTFEDNEVDGYGNTGTNSPSGGAILINGGQSNAVKATLKNNTFTRNIAHNTYSNDAGQGSAVYVYSENADVKIDNCTFTSNQAYTGGTIYVRKLANDLTVKDSDFVNNQVTTGSNTISPLGSMTSENVKINGLTIDDIDDNGNLELNANNYAELLNIISTIKTTSIVENITITLTGTEYTETESIILDNTFLPESLTIEGNAKTIDANGKQFLNISEGKNVTVKNLTVKNAVAENGAAIYNKGTLTVEDSAFEDNQVLHRGGAIYSEGSLTVNNSNFTNNKMTTIEGAGYVYSYGGGAICAFDDLTVDGCNFISNIAAHNDVEPKGDGGVAGAIYVVNDTKTVSIINSYFNKNTARHGGAITIENDVNQDGTILIKGNNFVENDALYGGAIDTYNKITITENNFTSNYVDGEGSGNRLPMGGAVCVNGQGYTATITNNNFTDNKAVGGRAGAVHLNPDTAVSSSGNTYEDNTAFRGGVFFDNGADIISENDIFKNNKADEGDIIYVNSTTNIGVGSASIRHAKIYGDESKFSGLYYLVGDSQLSTSDNQVHADASIQVTDNNGYEITGNEIVKDVTISDRITGDILIKVNGVDTDTSQVPYSSTTTSNNITFHITFDRNVLDKLSNKIEITYYNIVSATGSTEYASIEFNLIYNYTTLVPDNENVEAYVFIENPVVITGKVINYDGNNVTSGKVYLLDTTGEIAHSDVIVNGNYSISLPTSITNTVASKTYTLSYVDDVNYKNSQNITTITIKGIEGYIIADVSNPSEGPVNQEVSFTFTIKNGTDDNAGIIPVNGTLILSSTSTTGLAVPVNSTATFVNGVGVVGFTPDVAKVWSLYALFENATLDQAVGYNIASSSAIAYESLVLPATIVVSPETVTKVELNNNATILFTVVDGDNVITNLNKDNFTISVDGVKLTDGYNITIKGGNVTLDVLMSNLGSHTVTIAYLDDVYTATEDVAINVTKTVNMTIVNGDALVAYPGEEVSIQINVTDGNVAITQGKVTIVIDNVETQSPLSAEVDTTGIATVTWTPTLTNLGGHTINVVYEDAIYEAEPIDDGSITVEQVSIDASVNPEEGYIGVPVNITAEFTTADPSTIPVGYEVRFLSGETELGTALIDADGKATITSTFNAVGEYPVSVAFVQVLPDKYVLGTNTPANVTIHALPAEIILDKSSYVADLGENVQVDISIQAVLGNELISEGYIIVTDEEGTEIAREAVVNGEIPTVTIKAEKVGTNVYTVSYESAGNYEADNVTFTIEVEAIGTTVEFDTLPTNLTVGQTVEINVSVIAADNSIVNSGTVTFTDKYGQAIAQENVVEVENGKATLVYTASKVGSLKIFATYSGDNQTYAASEATAILKTGKAATTLTVDPVDAVIGKNITLTAHVENDNDYMPINEGKVVFKVNGKTIKDEAGKVIYVLVQDGVATLNYTVPESWNGKEITISAVYSGSTNYNSSRGETSDVIVLTGEASIEITSSPEFVKDAPKNFTAKVSDNGVPITEGRVVFKINGKTLKDPTTGKVIYTDVDANGVATLENFVVTSTYYKTSSWTLKAVFVSSAYDRVEATQDLEMVLQD